MFYFRAIFRPFWPRLQIKIVTLVTLAIVLCSLTLRIFRYTKYRFTKHESYVRNTTVFTYECKYHMTQREKFIEHVITYCIGLWFPIFTVIIVQIAMFFQLRKQARIRAQSTTSDTSGQMQRTLKIFLVVVLAFMVCSLPLSIVKLIKFFVSKNFYHSYLIQAHNVGIILWNLNVCLNPFIYGKIHYRIYKGIKRIWKVIKWKKDDENHDNRTESLPENKIYNQLETTSVGLMDTGSNRNKSYGYAASTGKLRDCNVICNRYTDRVKMNNSTVEIVNTD